jgi:glycosyltransferase involved in cell wall biosynthesis
VRPFNLIKQLAARNHRVTLFAVSCAGGSDDTRDVRAYCEVVEAVTVPRWQSWWSCLRALPGTVPLQAVYGASPAVRARVARLLGSGFDVVHIEHLRAALLGWNVRTPHVFDAVDCISQLFARTATLGAGALSRWGARFDLPRTRAFERRMLAHFQRIVATSDDERAALLALAPATQAHGLAQRISVLPNGVDLEYFKSMSVARDAATLVFVGRMSYHANVSAVAFLVDAVLPRMWRVRPDVRLNVVGEDPDPRLYRWAAASGGRITVTGTVADVRPYVAQATIAVCPVPYAVGIQNKVLEAMAMATATVCTPAAVRALTARDGHELLVGADADAFAGQALSLLDDAARRERLGTAARQYVERAHDWRASGEQLEAIYRDAIARSAMSNEP